MPKRGFGVGFQFADDERGNFFGRIRALFRENAHRFPKLALERVGNVCIILAQLVSAKTHEALDGINGLPRLQRPHVRRRLADKRRAFGGKMNDGWRQPRAVLVREQNRKPRVHYANERVSRPQIDADNFVHVERASAWRSEAATVATALCRSNTLWLPTGR